MLTISTLKEAGIFVTLLIFGGALYIGTLALIFLYQLARFAAKMIVKSKD